jgi:hypothetical protein
LALDNHSKEKQLTSRNQEETETNAKKPSNKIATKAGA